jgi:hypothetical protein
MFSIMTTMKRTGQILLGAFLSLAFVGACQRDDRAQERVDQAKAEAKEVKDRAEKRTDQAKEALDKRLDQTKEAVDRKVDEVKAEAKDVRDETRHDVRGNDGELGPDRPSWRSHWDHFYASPTAKWNGDDEWAVERDANGDVRAHRRNYDRSTGTKMDDDAVTTAVKGRLASDDDTRASKLDVDTHDGEVSLKGTVASSAAAGEAVRVALGTRGVRSVVSHLSVK